MNMKLVCELLVNGVMVTKTLTTANNIDHGAFVKIRPGVGNPFYLFNTLPGVVVAADYEGAPLVSESVSDNNAAIAVMLASPPLDKITFA